jgi:serine protease Do
MYFDDQNNQNNQNFSQNNPPQEPVSSEESSNPPVSGEYHFNRDNTPGGGSYDPNSGNGYQDGQNYQPNYQSSYQPNYNQNYNNQSYNPNMNGGYTSQPNANTGRRTKTKAPTPPKPPKKSGGAGKMVALALVCAILGGGVGAGGIYALSSSGVIGTTGGHATVSVSDRTGGTTVDTTSVQAGEEMTPAQIYSTYGSAVVSVTVRTSEGEGAGTGFIVDGEEGYLFTCYHVIDGATAISVTLTDSSSYEATYVGGDEDQDVAILKITPEEGTTLNSVVLGDSSLLAVGDDVCAIGNALGTLANTLTTGGVSALDRAITMSDGTVMNLLQTDTTINSGNSGGPLFNQYGEVVGIVNAKYSSSAYDTSTATIEGIGFAIPINDMKAIMDDLMEHGYVTGKPYLGISVSTVSAVAAQQYKNMVVGAYVNSVTSGSCAETAGLQVGDIITQVDGTDITTSAELIDAKNTHKAGEEMDLTVFRDSEYVTLRVTLDEEQPEDTTTTTDDSQSQSGQNSQGNSGNSYSYGYGYSWPYGFSGGW